MTRILLDARSFYNWLQWITNDVIIHEDLLEVPVRILYYHG